MVTRGEYLDVLLVLLGLLEKTLSAADHDERDHNYLALLHTLETYLLLQPVDGGVGEVHTLGALYLDRIGRLYLKRDWTNQYALAREWHYALLAIIQGV